MSPNSIDKKKKKILNLMNFSPCGFCVLPDSGGVLQAFQEHALLF